MLSLAILCTTAHTCAGCNDQLFASSGKPGARAPFDAWGQGLRSGSLPAFWEQGRMGGWGGGPGGVGWRAGWVGGGGPDEGGGPGLTLAEVHFLYWKLGDKQIN